MEFPAQTRGLFTTGGSMAHFNAVLCAREQYLGSEIRPGVLYGSTQMHHSMIKSARLAGIMPDRIRAVPVDGQFRMDVGALADAVAADRRGGLRPFCVMSSAGTTNTGAVDPLHAIADLCAREGLCTTWTVPTGRSSTCVRASGSHARACAGRFPHARSAQGPVPAIRHRSLLVRDGAALRRAHEATASYLPGPPESDDFYDPHQYGPELSRGFRAFVSGSA